MKMTPETFLDWEHKAITLLGMSGVGKTTLANKLPKTQWFHYSGDYRIGTKYLEEPILDNVKKQAMRVPFLRDLLRSDSIYICSNITVHNLEPVSTFLGKIGDPDRGGLSVAEFKRRQRLHLAAEIGAMTDVAEFIAKAHDIYGYEHFVNDAGGSVCELGNDAAMQVLADYSLIVYLRPDQRIEEELIQRAIDNPKPLYYQEDFLDRNLGAFLSLHGLDRVEQIDPDQFVRWIFPKLVEYRRPLYEAIAREHGYSVSARDAMTATGERDFLDLVVEALRR